MLYLLLMLSVISSDCVVVRQRTLWHFVVMLGISMTTSLVYPLMLWSTVNGQSPGASSSINNGGTGFPVALHLPMYLSLRNASGKSVSILVGNTACIRDKKLLIKEE